MDTTLKPFLGAARDGSELLPKIFPRLPDTYNTYIEPFLGSGPLFLCLRPQRVIANVNSFILKHVYETIRFFPEKFLQYLVHLDALFVTDPGSLYERLCIAFGQKMSEPESDTLLAALFVCLSWHCREPSYAGKPKDVFLAPNNLYTGSSVNPDNICGIHDYLSAIQFSLFHEDYYDLCIHNAKPGDFVFFNCFCGPFPGGVSMADHKKLSTLLDILSEWGVFCMMACPYSKDIPKLYRNQEYNLELFPKKRDGGNYALVWNYEASAVPV